MVPFTLMGVADESLRTNVMRNLIPNWDQVTRADRHCLLQQLAFSKSRHFSWDNFPTNTMAYDNMREQILKQNKKPADESSEDDNDDDE